MCCSLECSPAPAAFVQSRRSRGVRPSARHWTCRGWRKIGSCRSPAGGMCSCRARSGPGTAFSLCCPHSSESYCRLRPRQDHSQKSGKQSATFFLSLGYKLWAQQTCRHVRVLSPQLLSRAQGCAAWTSPSVRAFSSRSWSRLDSQGCLSSFPPAHRELSCRGRSSPAHSRGLHRLFVSTPSLQCQYPNQSLSFPYMISW